MAWFVPIALAAIQAGTAAYQGIKGAKQKREARALQREADLQERSNLADARRLSLTGMPDAEYQKALTNIDRNRALGLSELRSRRAALAGVSSLQQNTNDALVALSAEDARQRRTAELNALNQANRLASLTGNQAAERRFSGESLTGAAIQNVGNLASSAAMYAGGSNMGGSGLTSNTSRYNAFTPNYNLNSSIWGDKGYNGFNTNTYAKPF